MKTYFPDDPIKQELLNALIEMLKDSANEYSRIYRKRTWQEYYKTEISTIEKATNEKIEEVLG